MGRKLRTNCSASSKAEASRACDRDCVAFQGAFVASASIASSGRHRWLCSSTDPSSRRGRPRVEGVSGTEEASQQLFTDGLVKVQRGERSDALAAFQASFEIVASPNTKLLIAHQFAGLERWADAYNAYSEAAELASQAEDQAKYSTTRADALAARNEITGRIARLRIDVGSRTGPVVIGGQEVSALLDVAVNPGPVVVVFGPESGRETRSFDVSAGDERVVDFATAPNTEPVNVPTKPEVLPAEVDESSAAVPLMVAGGVFLALGAGGIATFAAFGVMTVDHEDQFALECPNKVCPASLRDEVQAAETDKLVANIAAAAGFGSAALGLALLIPGAVLNSQAVVVQAGPTSASLALRF